MLDRESHLEFPSSSVSAAVMVCSLSTHHPPIHGSSTLLFLQETHTPHPHQDSWDPGPCSNPGQVQQWEQEWDRCRSAPRPNPRHGV